MSFLGSFGKSSSTPIATTAFEEMYGPIEILRENFFESETLYKKRDKRNSNARFIIFVFNESIQEQFLNKKVSITGINNYSRPNFTNDERRQLRNLERQLAEAKTNPKNYNFKIYTLDQSSYRPVYVPISLEELGILIKNGKIQDNEVDFILDKSQIISLKSGYPIAIRPEQLLNRIYGGKHAYYKKTRRHTIRKRSRTRKH